MPPSGRTCPTSPAPPAAPPASRVGAPSRSRSGKAPEDHSADRARAEIAAALGQTGFTLPGSITIRRTRCGKPRCACAADPPSLHGPYLQWTRTVSGKTVTRLLTPAQYQACRRLTVPVVQEPGSACSIANA